MREGGKNETQSLHGTKIILEWKHKTALPVVEIEAKYAKMEYVTKQAELIAFYTSQYLLNI